MLTVDPEPAPRWLTDAHHYVRIAGYHTYRIFHGTWWQGHGLPHTGWGQDRRLAGHHQYLHQRGQGR